jgi:hypothetical protein
MPPMADLNIRISDAERDLAMAALGEHMSTGRLDLVEYDERCARAAAARTRAELETLFADLPLPHPNLSAAVPAVRTERKQVVGPTKNPLQSAMETIAGLTLILGIPAAILLTIFLGLWWLFFPIGGVFIVSVALSEAAKHADQD